MSPSTSQIAIVDYGMGNLRSVSKALEHLGAGVVVTDDRGTIERAAAVILPGVGAFGDTMKGLADRGLTEVVKARGQEALESGRPWLGICLGMQVLVEEGEESPGVHGLALLKGSCPRIRRTGLKIPHMGWNRLTLRNPCPLFQGFKDEIWVYFVHSYQVSPHDPDVIAATVDYGGEIVAAVSHGNLMAVQFHPEKSQHNGLRMLENFAELVRSAAAGS